MTLNEVLKPFGIELSDEQLEKFDALYDVLTEWNQKINLTAVTEKQDVVIKHFADSLIPLSLFEGKVLDVGAGAGFPSLPLAIANADLDVTMIDSVDKKVGYLNHTSQTLRLNARAIHIRAEDFAKGAGRESFDRVTARAVAACVTLAEYLLPLCKIGGKVIMYKSGDVEEELKEAEKCIAICGGKIAKIEKYEFGGQSRSIVIIDKITHTPSKYPRSGNKPRLQPIK